MKKIIIALILACIMALPASAFAAGSITVERNPGPPEVVLNNGSGKVTYQGNIVFDGSSIPYAYVLRVLRDVDSNGLANEDPANDICRVNGEADGSPTAGNMVGQASPFDIPAGECTIPNAADSGRYLVSVHFYVTDPLLTYRTDSDARATFYVNSPAAVSEIVIAKHEDMNGDGIRGEADKGLAGWVFTVTPPADSGSPFTVTTGADGTVRLSNIMPGAYTIAENLQDGWMFSNPANGSMTVEATAGNSAPATFLNSKPASVCGGVYHGETAATGTGLAGLILKLLNIEPEPEQNTGADGAYCFENLKPGEYQVSLGQTCGEELTVHSDADGVDTDNVRGVIKVALTSGQKLENQDFLCSAPDEQSDDPIDMPDDGEDEEDQDTVEEPNVPETTPIVAG